MIPNTLVYIGMNTSGKGMLLIATILIITHLKCGCVAAGIDTKKGSWMEKTLIKDLLTHYEKQARPVVDGASPVVKVDNESVLLINVRFGLALIQILELNENEQILTVSVKSLYSWSDYHLVWNPEEYDNITHISIPTETIWLPDIALYNYADERLEEKRDCGARISHEGQVEWHPMAIYKSTCPVKIRYFPYDKQVCNLRFGPWSHDNARVNITMYQKQNMDLEDYIESPEWQLENISVNIRVRSYPCCPEKFSDMLFHILIKRQPAYYNYLLILPCFLLSSLTLVLFWLPPETPAKMVLGMNIFLAFFLLLLLLEDSIPSASSSFPLIGNYYCINMTLVTLSTFLCLIVVNLHFRGDRQAEVPHWLRKLVIQHGARLLFVSVEPPGEPERKLPGTRDKEPYLKSKIPFCGGPIVYPYNLCRGAGQFEQCYPPAGQNMYYDPTALMDMYSNTPYPRYPPYPSSMNDGRISIDPSRDAAALRYPDYLPSSTIVEDETKQCSFCPACAGLAAANAASTTTSEDNMSPESQAYQLHQQQRNVVSMTNDPADELAAVWTTAISGEKPELNPWSPSSQGQVVADNELRKPRLQIKQFDYLQQAAPLWNNIERNGLTTEPSRLIPPSQFYRLVSPNCEEDTEEETDDVDHSNDEVESEEEDDGDDEESVENNSHTKTKLEHNIISRENIRLWNRSHRRNSGFQMTSNFYQDGEPEQQTEDKNNCVQCSMSTGTLNGRKDSSLIDPKLVRRIQRIRADILQIVRGIRYMQRRNKNKERINKLIAEWRAVGVVLDRLFFVIYIFALAISIICYFPRPGDDDNWPLKE